MTTVKMNGQLGIFSIISGKGDSFALVASCCIAYIIIFYLKRDAFLRKKMLIRGTLFPFMPRSKLTYSVHVSLLYDSEQSFNQLSAQTRAYCNLINTLWKLGEYNNIKIKKQNKTKKKKKKKKKHSLNVLRISITKYALLIGVEKGKIHV